MPAASTPDDENANNNYDDSHDGDEGSSDTFRTLGLPWWQVLVLLLVVGILGASIGHRLAQPDNPGAGSVDVGFLQDMRFHHDQAVELSFIYLAKGDQDIDVLLGAISREIIASQQLESGFMIQLLRGWEQIEQNESRTAMGWMGMAVSLEAMPGLATETQIDALEAAEGVEASRLFASLMIAHHEGGIHMAGHAAENAETKGVRVLANSMVVGQQGEVDELRAKLAELGGA